MQPPPGFDNNNSSNSNNNNTFNEVEFSAGGEGNESWRSKNIPDLDSLELLDMLHSHNCSVSITDVCREMQVTGHLFALSNFMDLFQESGAQSFAKFHVTPLHLEGFRQLREQILLGKKPNYDSSFSGGGDRHSSSRDSSTVTIQPKNSFEYFIDTDAQKTSCAPKDNAIVAIQAASGRLFHCQGASSKEACVATPVVVKKQYSTPAQRWRVEYREDGKYISFHPEFYPELALTAVSTGGGGGGLGDPFVSAAAAEGNSGPSGSVQIMYSDSMNDAQSFSFRKVSSSAWSGRKYQLVPKSQPTHALVLVEALPVLTADQHMFVQNLALISRKEGDTAKGDGKDWECQFNVRDITDSDKWPKITAHPPQKGVELTCCHGVECTSRCMESFACWYCQYHNMSLHILDDNECDLIPTSFSHGTAKKDDNCCNFSCHACLALFPYPPYFLFTQHVYLEAVRAKLNYTPYDQECCGWHQFCCCFLAATVTKELYDHDEWLGSICSGRTAPKVSLTDGVTPEEAFPDPNRIPIHQQQQPQPQEMGGNHNSGTVKLQNASATVTTV